MANRRRHGLILGVLTALFAIRVLGQAIQYWSPQQWLPDFGSFQGSSLPYGFLLATQLVILAAMARFALRPGSPSQRASRILFWLGGIYMLGSLARIFVGLTMPGAPAWFRTWIPAGFHVVLAAYVLTLADYHRPRR